MSDDGTTKVILGRWAVLAVFFVFSLLHSADRLLIGPLTTPIMSAFSLDEARMGALSMGAILVGAVLYPVWGYLFDRYARPRLLALAALIWGCTTWLSAIAPNYGLFLVTRASTGIDDSSSPGLYSLVSDYFGPGLRGRVYGIIEVSAPMGYLLAMVLALGLRDVMGWRGVYYVTGSLGLVTAAAILLWVREVPRGGAEPEMAGLQGVRAEYRFDRKTALGLFRKRTLILLFAQAFFGILPWQVITYWFFRYLEVERHYPPREVFVTMTVAILAMSLGRLMGGALGDFAFRRMRQGRVIVSGAGVVIALIALTMALQAPVANRGLFILLLVVTAFFMPFASPNVVSTVYDVTPPEVRSTAVAVLSFIQNGGSAVAPFLAGLIAVAYSLRDAILAISWVGWAVCAVLFLLAGLVVSKDMDALHELMQARAAEEAAISHGVVRV